ncbi:hypothetical protein [Nocardioides sp.]|uniref:hypothetical protein n=1 Tax=Nocardioides sp. TaxID=35761 RepID=UPI002615D931|nr:hypothetical protein [Nocardioides sp.]
MRTRLVAALGAAALTLTGLTALDALTGSASATAPAPTPVTGSGAVTFTGCDIRTDRSDPNTRQGSVFSWTPTIDLAADSPVSATQPGGQTVTATLPTPLPAAAFPTSLTEPEVTVALGFDLGPMTYAITTTSKRANIGAGTSTFKLGTVQTTDLAYGLGGYHRWRPTSLRIDFVPDWPETPLYLQCASVATAQSPTLLTTAVYNTETSARAGLYQPSGLALTGARQGSWVAFRGSEFESDGVVRVRLGATTVATVRADVTGAISGRFQVPATAPARPLEVRFLGASTLKSVTLRHLYVSLARTSLTARPSAVKRSRTSVVTGRGYVAGEPVTLILKRQGTAKVLRRTHATVRPDGTVTIAVKTKRAWKKGRYTVRVVGAASGRTSTLVLRLR